MEHECAGISGRSPAEADGREDNDEDPEYLIEFRVFVFNGLEHGEPSFAVCGIGGYVGISLQ